MVEGYTKGRGVDVVYDSIGKDTFPASLDCLKPLGMWVSFGQASGPVPEFKITLLSQKGSLYATRPFPRLTRRCGRISLLPPTTCSRWWAPAR